MGKLQLLLFANKPQEGSKTVTENNEVENKSKEEYKKSNKSLLKRGNSSLNISNFQKIFEKQDLNNININKSFCHKEKKNRKFDSKRISDFMNTFKNSTINKNFGARKKKFKSFIIMI